MNTSLKRTLSVVLFTGLVAISVPIFGKQNDSFGTKAAKRFLTGTTLTAAGFAIVKVSIDVLKNNFATSTITIGACNFAQITGILSALFGLVTVIDSLDALDNFLAENRYGEKQVEAIEKRIENLTEKIEKKYNQLSQQTQNTIEVFASLSGGLAGTMLGLHLIGTVTKPDSLESVDTTAMIGALGFFTTAISMGFVGYAIKKFYNCFAKNKIAT